MKKYIALIFILYTSIFAQISWERVHPKLQDQIFDIAVIDDTIAVACGSNGGIFSTRNGGTTWSTNLSQVSSDLYGIAYKDGYLYCVGANGTIVKSADSSTSWNQIIAPSVTGTLMATTFFDSIRGWAVGELGVIYFTGDGGNNWTTQNGTTLSNGWLRDVYFISNNIGFVCGTNRSYGRTTNGGNTWTLTEGSGGFNEPTYYKIDFYDSNHGWMVGTGDALVTTDAGVNWNNNGLTNAVFGETMYDIEMIDAMIWYISGSNGKVGRTYDGGTNWVFTTVGGGSFNLYATDFSTTNNGWVVGDGGVIFKTTDGSNWSSQIATKTRNNLNSAKFFNNDTGYVVGNGGVILKTYNKGISWSDESSKLNTSENLNDICFPSDSVGYICGDWVFFSTIDGGSTWNKQIMQNQYYSIKFLNENVGWMVGGSEGGVVAKTTNRGDSWTKVTTPALLTDFDIVSANILFATGVDGAIYKTQDGGKTWGSISNPINDSFNSIQFYDDKELGFALSSAGHIYRTTNGGTTWDSTDARLTISQPIYDIEIINPSNIYVVGDQGSVYYSTDVGVSWQDMGDNMTSFSYSKIIATDRSHFWRVGGGGNAHFGIDQTAGQTPAPSLNIYPLDGDIDIEFNTTLKWKDSGAAEPTGYVLYFGTDGGGTSTPTNIVNGTDLGLLTNYVTGKLAENTTYYWQIVPYNANGSTPSQYCPIWKFTTRKSLYFGGGGITAPGYFFANSSDSAAGAPSQPVYSWQDPIVTGQTPINNWTSGNADDGYYGPVSMGITFPFFGRNYTSLYIGTNGNLTFSSGYSSPGTSLSIPDKSSPNNYIAALVMDLDSSASSQIYYGLVNGVFIVTWYHYYAKGTTDYISFQAYLHSNGYIKVMYNDVESTFPLPSSIGNDALIGIEGKYGSQGISYRNNGVGGNIFGSPVALAFGDNNSALPVELNSFSAVIEGKNVVLDWTTATELNNYGFEIARIGGKSHNWEKVGFVAGSGNSFSPKSYRFVDEQPAAPGKTRIKYKLKQIDFDGNFEYSDIVEVDFVNKESKFFLSQNTPNPFNPSTKIKFSIPEGNSVKNHTILNIYDVLGRLVKTLINRKLEAGEYEVEFNAENLSSGIYFYSLTSGNFQSIRKMVLVK